MGTLAEPEKQEPAEVAAKQVSEYAKWMDNSESMLKESDGSASTAASSTTTTSFQEAPLTSEQQLASGAVDASETDPAVLEKKLNETRDEIARLQGKLDGLLDDKLAYFPLMDRCLERKVSEYVYKI